MNVTVGDRAWRLPREQFVAAWKAAATLDEVAARRRARTGGRDGPKTDAPPAALGAGAHTRTPTVGGRKRSSLVHVPKRYDPETPTPVVLALHGAAMNGPMMVGFSGLNKRSDAAGFVVAYPSGTGTGPFVTWNAGGFTVRARRIT